MSTQQKKKQIQTEARTQDTKPTDLSKKEENRKTSLKNEAEEKPVIRQIPIDGNADTNMRIIEIRQKEKCRYTMAYGNVGLLKKEEMLEAGNAEEELKCIGKLQHILSSEAWMLIERMACVIANGKQA